MIKTFQKYIKESSELEFIEVIRRMEDIHDEFFTYDAVQNYLLKELLGETVNVNIAKSLYNGQEVRNLDIKVINILVDKRLEIIFIDSNGISWNIPYYAYLKWEKLISRNYSDIDPYGEEEE